MTKLTALFLISLTTAALSLEPVPFTINTKKWSHVLDDHFISITVNPTDLLQGKVYGLQMNSTMAILKGLAPAYVRIGSADTAKYTFKRARYPSDVVKPDDEYTVTETHWMVFNEVAQQAGLDVIVCLNAAHRSEGTKKWDTRNSLELISFSDSQGYNLTWQLGYEVQPGDDISGIQFGKDLNRLRTILNAFPRYQQSKLIGPDIRVIHKKEDVDFWNDMLLEAGPTLDAVTWHPRWPQPSKMKVSDNSELGYEFPIDYLEWDKAQLNKLLQKSIFRNPIWIGETKRESTGTFAEGLIWARRLVFAAKSGVEVVMKQPNLMDVTHPKPEYWIALLHKRLLGKSVLETKNVGNSSDLSVISHCTNPFYWSDKPEKLQDGSVTVYAVNMGGLEQKIHIRGTWTGKSQLVFQYVLTSGSDPDSVFSQMTYLNGEPLMMTDDGLLPDIIPKIKKLQRGLIMKLPPYSVGFFVVPDAKVKICQIQQQNIPTINIETLTPSNVIKTPPKSLENIQDINQFMVEKLKNPESESEEVQELKIEAGSSESSEKDISNENTLPRVARRIREVNPMDELNQQIKTIMKETQEFLASPENGKNFNLKTKLPKASKTMEQRIQGLAEGIKDAIKFTNQEQEFNKFLEHSGLKQDFGSLIMNDGRFKSSGGNNFRPFLHTQNPEGRLDEFEVKQRLRRSISESEEFSQEESTEDETEPITFGKKISVKDDDERSNQKQDILIPHQPDLKGLEERYKQIVHIKLQDGKRKIDDIKRKIKQDESSPKVKPTETVNDIQEEIIKKEIELLEKTEETVADILKSQKMRQETFEDIIFDELHDVKGERIRELKEMHKNQKKNENAIVKRQVQTPLSKPLLKTVEYIEKNLNLEPESVRKIKRSLEERMGEILRNYDTRKSMEVKKRLTPLKEERKVILRKSAKETERKPDSKPRRDRGEEESDEERQTVKERPKEKNIIKKPTSQIHHKSSKKPTEERNRKPEEVKKSYQDDNDSFEMFNEKKMEDIVKKPERRRPVEVSEVKKTTKKTKTIKTSEEREDEEIEKKKKKEIKKDTEKDTRKESIPEPPILKNDKERREHMLQQITMMVDKINSKERDGSRKRKEDDDISEEFESDRRPRGIKRRPRKAEITDERISIPVFEKPEEDTPENQIGDAKQTSIKKLRKLRLRGNRKQKKGQSEDTEETPQSKRHLSVLERPLMELEKKKLIKPKHRKISPKFISRGNEFPKNYKQDNPPEPEKMVENVEQLKEIPEITPDSVLLENEQLKKDLEQMVEEKIFLGQGTGTSNDRSEKNGGESSNQEETKSEESQTATETTVKPTEEIKPDEVAATENVQISLLDGITEDEKVKMEKLKNSEQLVEDEKIPENPVKDEKSSEQLVKDEKSSENVAKDEQISEKLAEEDKSPKTEDSSAESEEDVMSIAQMKNLEAEMRKKVSSEEGSDSSSVEESIEKQDDELLPVNAGIDVSQRKRRATFLPKHGVEDENDYSSEERIQKFKQMVYRKSPSKKPLKNDVRSTSGMGMGADEFLRMAGSTVRVMFDDVIPEAYGQTKNKIQNMGISEYIKEFGNIVQQMKNLDQIFLNIGEAAVKGYIRGNRAEKGPYIQVISRKKRGTKSEDMVADAEPEKELEASSEISKEPNPRETGSSEFGTTATEEEITSSGQRDNREDNWNLGGTGRELGESVSEVDKTKSVETSEATQEKMETTDVEKVVEKEETTPEEKELPKSKLFQNVPKIGKKTDLPTLHNILKDNVVSNRKKMIAYVPEDLQEKIFSPWIKTTNDFIQQALTTLQRQRELSEILASDLMNREITKRAIEKREAGDLEPKLPVYHMVPPRGNKKRETQKQSDESLIRHLRGLQPGVYVVPTEEMTNIRSEQITNEQKQKSGLPNVVTLNIYYDKKNADASSDAASNTDTESKITQDAVTYYQNKWNNPGRQYEQLNQYLTAQDINLANPFVVNPALQTQTVFQAEPRVTNLPNSRLVQYPPPAYHYPPIQKMYPGVVPNPQLAYGPVYYLPQENRYASQPPGTKRQWREFKARSPTVPLAAGWNIQYDLPASLKAATTAALPSSYNKNYKLVTQDKKRSIGDGNRVDPTWSEAALPFWKFFSTSEKINRKESESVEKTEGTSFESDSSEDVFAENRKRAKQAEEKKVKESSVEQVGEEKVPEEEEEEEEKSRKRRSISDGTKHKLSKRSPYDFRDHDILPEWFGTYREIENGLENFPPHVRRSHIVSTPWSEEDEELLNILEADDELSLIDLVTDDDYYYSNDNSIQHLRRYPRSTDQFDSNMIKTNMIYKMPMDGDHLKPKGLGMAGIKKLTDEDSSLERVTKSKPVEVKPTGTEPGTTQQKKPEGATTTQHQKEEQQKSTTEWAVLTTSTPSVNGSQPSQNGTFLLPRNLHDDTLYYFFKYAYDSLVKVMKSMSGFF